MDTPAPSNEAAIYYLSVPSSSSLNSCSFDSVAATEKNSTKT